MCQRNNIWCQEYTNEYILIIILFFSYWNFSLASFFVNWYNIQRKYLFFYYILQFYYISFIIFYNFIILLLLYFTILSYFFYYILQFHYISNPFELLCNSLNDYLRTNWWEPCEWTHVHTFKSQIIQIDLKLKDETRGYYAIHNRREERIERRELINDWLMDKWYCDEWEIPIPVVNTRESARISITSCHTKWNVTLLLQ